MATSISYPFALPAFIARQHTREPEAVCTGVEMDQGAPRSRRRVTVAFQYTTYSTRLTQTQFDIFDEWYEAVLRAGALSFYVPIAGPMFASGIEWHEACFVRTPGERAYRWGQRNGLLYTVQARLLLLAGPYETRPAPGELQAEATIDIDADADLTVQPELEAEAGIDIVADGAISVEKPIEAEATLDVDADANVGIAQPVEAEAAIDVDADADLTVDTAADVRTTSGGDTRVTSGGDRRVVSI